jgi:hypothetical protein
MKKSIVFIILILLCIGMTTVAATENDCYVKVGDNIYFGKDIKTGWVHTEIVMPDGTVTEVHNRDITALRHHNKLYMMLPVICDRNDTICMAMMEYLTTRKGVVIFRYCCRNNEDLVMTSTKDFYFLYKQGKFYRRINPEDAEAELPAFGIKVI